MDLIPDSMDQAQAEHGLNEEWDILMHAAAWGEVLKRLHQDSTTNQDKDTDMKIGDMIESRYLKQSDVGDEQLTVTVKGLKKVNVARDDEDPEYRWTVTFDEMHKPMVLNVTNLKRMAKALGDDTEMWTGGKVQLYVDPDIEFGGNIVGGLRIRSLKREGTKPKRTSMDDANAQLRGIDDDSPPF